MYRLKYVLLLLTALLTVACTSRRKEAWQELQFPDQGLNSSLSNSEGTGISVSPEAWKGIKLPETGLQEILPSSNENGFYADYSDITREALITNIFNALDASGFEKVCEKLDGELLGFRRDDEQLVMKIDLFDDVHALSLFDENGSDPILHGICFAGYELGPEIKIR